MCRSCGGSNKTPTGTQYKITYPEGSGRKDKIVYSELAAKIAVQAVAGAKWEKL